MKKPVLVIMAAGRGSRYGGLKQIDKIDAAGHIIMDFSIFDAKRAGFEKVVFIIKRENLELFKEVIGDAVAAQMEVAFAFFVRSPESVKDVDQVRGIIEDLWGGGKLHPSFKIHKMTELSA